ncbi:hypothetical protein GCM10010872_31380 [Dyella flava]|nr:hypothetical protein GCM10010872_31380 [Dyella flava]
MLVAATGWLAVLLQLYLSLALALAQGKTMGQGLVMYFGYFTILTNLLVCLAVTWPLLAPNSGPGRYFARPIVTGWVTASIAFVGIAYYVLLRHVWQPQGLRLLADVLLHYVSPALCVIYSLIVLRGSALRWTAPLWWSIYLLIYFAYALLRGALIGSYPYGFIDASALGYAVAVRNGFLLLIAFLLLAYLLMLAWRIGAKRD